LAFFERAPNPIDLAFEELKIKLAAEAEADKLKIVKLESEIAEKKEKNP
jgi:hypothetical protein